MINIALVLVESIICYIVFTLLFKKYKTDGIYVFAIIATFIACVMNLKTISIMNISVPLGFGVTTSIILGANLITQRQGLIEIKNYLLIVIITGIVACGILNISGMISISDYNYLANKAYDNIFVYNIRIYLALIVSLVVSIIISTRLFYTIKRLKNKIVLSNVFSIIITEFVENIIFILIAYLFEYQTIDLILCIIFRYTIKIIIGILGTIPLYIANKNNW